MTIGHNQFCRRHEGIDISYTKKLNDLDSPCNKVVPPLGLLQVGWNEPGEWFNITVDAAETDTFVADLLYTAQRNGSISISVDGGPAIASQIVSTFDSAETIPWRQWHDWNVSRDAFSLTLRKGVHVLTVRVVTGGNMILATFDFRAADTLRSEPGITAVKTAGP